jgi:hypothetical protein
MRDPGGAYVSLRAAMVVGAIDLNRLRGWVKRHYLLLIVEGPPAAQGGSSRLARLTCCNPVISALDDGCRR